MTFLRGLRENDPQPQDDDKTLVLPPKREQVRTCVFISPNGKQRYRVEIGSLKYRLMKEVGYKLEGNT